MNYTNEQYEHVFNWLLENGYVDLAYTYLSKLALDLDNSIDDILDAYLDAGNRYFKLDDITQSVLEYSDNELHLSIFEVLNKNIASMLGYIYKYDFLPVNPKQYELWRDGDNYIY